MTPEELQKFIEKNATPQKERERVVGLRRYNLAIFKYNEKGEKEILGTAEYLTLSKARKMKAEFLREEGVFTDIVEDVTTDRNGNEIKFTEKPEHPIVCGKTEFNTPAATKSIIERDRKKERSKKSFVAKRNHAHRVSNKSYRLVGRTYTDPKSSLYELYKAAIKKYGYTVIDKITGQKYVGLQNEIAELIFDLLKSGRNKNDLDISFNGV